MAGALASEKISWSHPSHVRFATLSTSARVAGVLRIQIVPMFSTLYRGPSYLRARGHGA